VVSLRCEGGKTVTMAVADNGVGLPAGIAEKQSLGTRIVEILTQQLGGILARQSGDGVATAITFARSSRP